MPATRMRGLAIRAFIANQEHILSEIAAGWPAKHVHDHLPSSVRRNLSYSMLCLYLDRIQKHGTLRLPRKPRSDRKSPATLPSPAPAPPTAAVRDDDGADESLPAFTPLRNK